MTCTVDSNFICEFDMQQTPGTTEKERDGQHNGVTFRRFLLSIMTCISFDGFNFSSAFGSVIYLCFPIRYTILLPVHLLGSDLYNTV
jgi:hypothetical protein